MFKNFTFWIITFLFVVLGITSYYFLSNLDKDDIDNTTKIFRSLVVYITGYGVFFTIYATASQFSLSKNDKEKDRLFKMKEEAFKLILRWDDPAILNARNYSREIKDTHQTISPEKLISDIKDNTSRAASVSVLFNYAEHIKVAAENGIADKEILGNVCYALKDILERFKPYSDDLAKGSELMKKDNDKTMAVLNECIEAYKKNVYKQ